MRALLTAALLFCAAAQRRRVAVSYSGEQIYNITVLWSEPC